MNLLLEKVESPGSQRTAVIMVSRGVTLLVCGSGQLVFVMARTFVPFTETRHEKTKWMDLFLEKVESPESSRRFRRKQTMITTITLACASSCSGWWSTLCNGTPARTAGVSLVQILGEAGIGLITDVVASSTSADPLRTRLGEHTSRVDDLETRFAD